jgi:chromosome segregation ATPase
MEETLQTIGEKLVKLDEKLDQKVDAFGKRFDEKLDAFGKRFDEKLDAFGKQVDEKLDAGFSAVAVHFGKIDEHFGRIDEHFGRIDEHLTRIDGRLLQFDGRFKQNDDRFGRIEKRIDDLERRVLTGFEEVKGGLTLVAERVDDFLKKDTANSAAHAKFDQMLENHDNRIIALETGHVRRAPESHESPPRSGPALTNSDHDLE